MKEEESQKGGGEKTLELQGRGRRRSEGSLMAAATGGGGEEKKPRRMEGCQHRGNTWVLPGSPDHPNRRVAAFLPSNTGTIRNRLALCHFLSLLGISPARLLIYAGKQQSS